MSIVQMQRINLCALNKNRKAILERLQAMGAIEVDIRLDEDIGYQKQDVRMIKADFEKKARTADMALDILQRYVPEKTGIFDSLAGKPLIDKEIFDSIAGQQERYNSVAEHLIKLDKQISEQKANVQNFQNQAEALAPWLSLNVPMNYPGTEKTSVFIGSLAGNQTYESIWKTLKKALPDTETIDVSILSQDKDFTYLFVICMKADAQKMEEVLRQAGFARPAQIVNDIPLAYKEKCLEKIQESLAQIEILSKEIGSLSGERKSLRMISDYYRLRAERYEVLGKLPQTKNTFVLSGFVPEKNADQIAEHLRKNYEAYVVIEDVGESEEAPVLLENNRFAEAGEGVLSSFGLPTVKEIDPTAIMTFFYVFLFGLMLADVAYGLIVAVACGVMLKKFPRMEDNLRKSLMLFFMCGISTIFWGVMFGGYFGDAVNIISRNFFGKEITIPALWFVPLEEPMRMLLWSIIFGIIHMYTGLALKTYICIKNKKYMDALCDVGFWALLLTGLILMLVPSSLFASMFQMEVVLPSFVNVLAKAMAIVGAGGILLMSGRGQKNKWGLRIALGAYDLYNITSWLSDALSYSRLLALGLATGVIASVFNQMGSMFGDGIVGTIIFIVVFIVGHIFNLALNLLGTYVHTCRLQYIEFFGKFYEGGGREFHPFRSNTKYIDIKEEI